MVSEDKVKTATREELNKKEDNKERTEKIRIRLFPIWLRLIIVVLLMAIALAVGAMVGYGVLGGQNPLDALKWSTWQHIIDLVEKKS
ncbi:DNA-directed RNA polymerase subunit beta [Metabacillus sp. RGM 3146]|uniref:DNA-directed RNA polymerase subunit beta n=1 Tax=Metabacillus sp. RGM 3146 TaxID=3401092 RepID=UPI003B9BC56A